MCSLTELPTVAVASLEVPSPPFQLRVSGMRRKFNDENIEDAEASVVRPPMKDVQRKRNN